MIGSRFGALVVVASLGDGRSHPATDDSLEMYVRGGNGRNLMCRCDCGLLCTASVRELTCARMPGRRFACSTCERPFREAYARELRRAREAARAALETHAGEAREIRKRARALTQRMVRRGEIALGTECVLCGSQRRVQVHHEDYTRPDLAIALCEHHHFARHARLRDAGKDPGWMLALELARKADALVAGAA